MAANCVDWDTVADAVRDVLTSGTSPVSRIGTVSIRPGGVPTWIKTALPQQAYWEIDVTSTGEEFASIGTQAFENLSVRLDGWMPYSYENPNTSIVWRALVKAVRDRLRTYPTLANAVDGLTNGRWLPQVTKNERVGFPDGEKEILAHHVQIEMRYSRYFTFSTSVTIP